MIYPIGERTRGAYSGAQWLLRLRSPEKDSGSGDQSVVESLREFSCMFPPNMGVSVFCTSPGSMHPENLTRTILERGPDRGDACYVQFMSRVRSALGQFYGSVRSLGPR